MTIRQLVGDCRVQLATLEAGSVQTCITSPPYWGLRDYGTPPLVWGGDPEHAHEWGPAHTAGWHIGTATGVASSTLARSAAEAQARNKTSITGKSMGSFCPCGAWLGSLGLEPTPERFVDHIVECFRHVRRVLRDDATLWVNLGDSYAGSGKGPSGNNGIGGQSDRQGWEGSRRTGTDKSDSNRGSQKYALVNGGKPAYGYKPKDLMMIPFRVAMALQADGWYLRSVIPWLKRNSMPESVTDRPSTSVEYVFLLSKRERYYWDAAAVRMPWADARQGRDGSNLTSVRNVGGRSDGFTKPNGVDPSQNGGRNRRNSDWWFESWQGVLLDESDDPLAFIVNPQPLKLAHFATFPPKLVEPMVKASTSERGQCPECGAPWVRQREPTTAYRERLATANDRGDWYPRTGTVEKRDDGTKHGKLEGGITSEYITTGWRPTCAHTAEPVPQTVLDPFGGAGTVGLVADRLGRNAVLVDLKPEYSAMAVDRLTGDAPMFVEMGEAPA